MSAQYCGCDPEENHPCDQHLPLLHTMEPFAWLEKPPMPWTSVPQRPWAAPVTFPATDECGCPVCAPSPSSFTAEDIIAARARVAPYIKPCGCRTGYPEVCDVCQGVGGKDEMFTPSPGTLPGDVFYDGLKEVTTQVEPKPWPDPWTELMTADEFHTAVSSSPVSGQMQQFHTGATRSADEDKPDFEGFLCPLVLESFGAYMHEHRKQADGQLRASDNWQKGIPMDKYMKSLWRHFHQAWKIHRGYVVLDSDDGHRVTQEEANNAMLFNVMGYQHELLKPEQEEQAA